MLSLQRKPQGLRKGWNMRRLYGSILGAALLGAAGCCCTRIAGVCDCVGPGTSNPCNYWTQPGLELVPATHVAPSPPSAAAAVPGGSLEPMPKPEPLQGPEAIKAPDAPKLPKEEEQEVNTPALGRPADGHAAPRP